MIGLQLTVTTPVLPLWVPAEAAAAISDLMLGTVHLILTDIAGRISERAPVGISGNLAQSFTADPASSVGGVEIVGGGSPTEDIQGRVFSSLPYAVVMDQGRQPGKPISKEGIDAIGLWAQRKLGLSEKDANHAKYAIANKIVARGIEARHYVQAAFDSGAARWQQMLDDLAADIATALVTPAGGGGAPGQTRDSNGRFVKSS